MPSTSWTRPGILDPFGQVLLLGSACILVEPFNGASPGLLRRRPVVALWRSVIEEAVHRVRIDMALERDVVLLQLGSLCRIASR
jgi:hypothetical protein